MRKKFLCLLMIAVACFSVASAQDMEALLQSTRAKIDKVTDYQASGKMKTNVAFLKVPIANVSVYFKRPDKLKIKSEKGISFIPKGAVSINLTSLLNQQNYSIIDAGTEKIGNDMVRIAKLLPNDDNSDVVLSTLYIDPVKQLILKARTTTKEAGTYELEMTYGKYSEYALPDKIIFSFNIKDYKLPKGVTFDFDDGTAAKTPAEKMKNKKGKAEIVFKNYIINKGVAESVFQ